MRRWFILIAVTSTLGLSAMIGHALQESISAPKWTPFETAAETAVPIVGARLNRGEAYRLALDFNIPDVILDEFLVVGTGMKLVDKGESTTIDYYGSKEKVPVVYLDSLEVGGMERRGIRTLLIQGDDLGSRDGIPTYGRLGASFFGPLRLTVHYPRKLFLLEASPEEEVPSGGVEFRIEERYLMVDAQLNGSLRGRFVIDPAATFTTLDESWARKNGLAEKGAHRVDIDLLQVGGFSANRVPAILENMKKLPYKSRPVGVFGSSLLKETAVTYDFPRGLVWLRWEGASP